MTDRAFELTRTAIATHLDVDPDHIHADQSLTEDLGLDPLDLILVGMRLEELAGRSFPIAVVQRLHTVDSLASVVRIWLLQTPYEPMSPVSAAAR